MTFINWNSEREKKSFIIKKKIDELDILINDEKIMEPLKIKFNSKSLEGVKITLLIGNINLEN